MKRNQVLALDHQLTRLLSILRTARYAGHCCFTTGDFCYRWQTETAAAAPPETRIWTDASGSDTGFGWLSGDQLHIVTSTETDILRAEILDWGEAQLERGGHARALRIPLDQRSDGWRSLLAERGYQPSEPTLVLRSRALESSPASQTLAGGYRIEHVTTPAQAAGWASAYREAFAPEAMTSAVRRAICASPLYRPELDLVACDADGAIVAFALAWFDPVTATGTFEPLGCVPAHQRRGLSRELLLAGLRRLRALGARRAFVTTTTRRIPANRLYASIGFHVAALSPTWRKPA